MKAKPILLSLMLVVMHVMLWGQALAQVPPHAPGTICFTPYFWCWAQPPGPSGTSCGCPSNQGWVQGIRG